VNTGAAARCSPTATSVRSVKWLDRYWDSLFAKPAPFDCGWCSRGGDFGRHDMCTGSAVRPHREGSLRPAAVTECACALRQHQAAVRPHVPEESWFPTRADGTAVPERAFTWPRSVEGDLDARFDPYRHVPRPPNGTPQERRRSRDRRRRVAAMKSVLPAMAVVVALAVVSRCDGGGIGGLRSRAPGAPATGEPAVWKVDPVRPPRTESRSFTALVSQLGCGRALDVLAPEVIENPVSVVVIFRAAPSTRGSAEACAMNAAVPYSVRLATPLGDRTLFDGTCDLPPASSAPECLTAQRWPLIG
jgi:hypothetical protein